MEAFDRSSVEPPKNTIFIIGGMKGRNMEPVSVVLDRSRWIEFKLKLPYETWGSGGACLQDEIYLFGGYRNPRALYKLDKNRKWIRLADMNIGRARIRNSCVTLNGCIWVFGGEDEDGEALKSVERYDPKTNKWTPMPDMKHARSLAAAAVWNDKIIISGGSTGQGPTNSVECFNPEGGFWAELPNLPQGLSAHSLISFEGKLMALGGTESEKNANAWEMDAVTLEWRPLPPMKLPSCFSGIVLANRVYAIGGRTEKSIRQVQIFNGNSWRDGPPLPFSHCSMSPIIIPQYLADRFCNSKTNK